MAGSGGQTHVPGDVAVGVLATVSMDVVLVAVSLAGGSRFASERVGLGPVGRWATGLAGGRVTHRDLAAEPPLPHEDAVGLGVHYATGVILTCIYHEAMRRSGRQAGIATAAAYGAATALLPLLVMYPSWGLGPLGLRSGECARLVRLMLIGHTAFGAAIGAWSRILGARADERG